MTKSLVIDGVAHAYNFSDENLAVPTYSQRFAEGTFFKHRAFSPPEYRMTREQFMQDLDPEVSAYSMFAESDVDVAVFHSVPIYDFFHDGLVSMEKGRLLKEKYPDRFLWYGAIHALDGPKALEVMEYQAKELGVDGFKFYPAMYFKGRTVGWRMDDESLAFPLFEKALELGIPHVAVHKAIPLGPTTTKPYRVDDVEQAAAVFPELSIEIVHAGYAFNEETALMLGRFPNVYANFEGTFGYITKRPRVFAKVLGEMLYFASPEQLIFASGCNVLHPRPLIDAFREFQIPEDMQEGYGYAALTDEVKDLILGGNLARLHGLDADTVLERTAGDGFAKAKADAPGPWSRLEPSSDGATTSVGG